MRQDLDKLKTEIEAALRERDLVVFHGRSFDLEKQNVPYYWDTMSRANPAEFLDTAKALGVKLVVYHAERLTRGMLDVAQDRLDDAEISPDELRELQREVKRLRSYEGFLSGIELGYVYSGGQYVFDVTADWYNDYLTLLERIDAADQLGMDEMDEEEEEDDESMGGYYSRN